MSEDRYEALEMIIKVREDGVSWFDYLFDVIAGECEGDPESEENTCTCGMESMGGCSGTLDQCYEWTTNVAAKISPIMIARAVVALWERRYGDEDTDKIIEWAKHEIEFEEYFENREWENEEEEENEL